MILPSDSLKCHRNPSSCLGNSREVSRWFLKNAQYEKFTKSFRFKQLRRVEKKVHVVCSRMSLPLPPYTMISVSHIAQQQQPQEKKISIILFTQRHLILRVKINKRLTDLHTHLFFGARVKVVEEDDGTSHWHESWCPATRMYVMMSAFLHSFKNGSCEFVFFFLLSFRLANRLQVMYKSSVTATQNTKNKCPRHGSRCNATQPSGQEQKKRAQNTPILVDRSMNFKWSVSQ